jgi:uridine kinase
VAGPAALPARVVVLAGPSGAGKSHLADRLGLPVLRLDDFYRDGDDPGLPRLALAGGPSIVDWDDPASWDRAAALEAIEALCRRGCADVPVYDLSTSRRTGHRVLALEGARVFLAEGIFAHEVVAGCRERGVLADAICVTQHPGLTFLRRLSRDLAEHRKPPLVLVRRGLHLMRRQGEVVDRARRAGCRVLDPPAAYAAIRALAG